MPLSGRKETGAGLDVIKLRKLVNLLQSNRAGEADTARLKAIELCAGCGLTLPEGLALAGAVYRRQTGCCSPRRSKGAGDEKAAEGGTGVREMRPMRD